MSDVAVGTTYPTAAAYEKSCAVLPHPPTDEETSQYGERNVAVLVLSSLISVSCLSLSQVHLLLFRRWLLVLAPFLLFTLVYYLISLRISIQRRRFSLTAHRTLVSAWNPTSRPTVDILLPICREGMDVLVNTWEGVAQLRDRYGRDRVEVHVLDDGDDAAARVAAEAFGFLYKVRPNRGWFKKAGNLRHGFETSNGEFIAIFDADFRPRADFLEQLLPYHAADQTLGIVQSPQYFRPTKSQTWIERGAGAVQELFYRSVQVARDKYDAAICVGSCAIYRRQALDAIGGTALIEHSEDVHTGFDLRRAGWGLRYVPIPLATGVCPERPDSFLTQQYRWCAGSMSLLASEKFWRTRLRFTSRLCYVSGFCYYVHTALFTFLTPVIPIVLIVVEPREVRIANYLLIIPSTLYNLVVFPLWNRCRYGFTALIARYLYGWAHVFAIADCLRGRRVGWQATGGVGAKASTARVWRAIAWWGGCTTIIWVVGSLVRARQFGLVNWSFILLTGLLYGAVIIAAVRERDPSGLSRVRGVIGPRQTGGEVTR